MIKRKPPNGRRAKQRPTAAAEEPYWLFGVHAVLAALANPRRRCHRLLLGAEAAHSHGKRIQGLLAAARPGPGLTPERASGDDIARALPDGAVHQGLAVLAAPLVQPSLDALMTAALTREKVIRPVLVVLDQVTDPHNVGAILRSAAAFGAAAVVAPKRHAAAESGTLAKAASGAFEHVAYIQVANLARALAAMKAAGFWSLGLAGEAAHTLAEADPRTPLALVLGAEGRGLRRLTREACDVLARLPTRAPIDSLNVSNAAAVALYQVLGCA